MSDDDQREALNDDQRLVIHGQVADGELQLVGEIDAHTAQHLDEVLGDAPDGTRMVLDMAEVSFLDSSGLRTIVSVHNRLDAAGGRLEMRGPSTAVTRLLELAGLAQHLHLT